MPRVKRGSSRRDNRKKIMKLAKGYRGARGRLYHPALEQVERSGQFAYRHRKMRKREFRRLWVARINAAARIEGLSYSQFIHGLKLAGHEVNRKMLSEMAIHEPKAFSALAEAAKTVLAT